MQVTVIAPIGQKRWGQERAQMVLLIQMTRITRAAHSEAELQGYTYNFG